MSGSLEGLRADAGIEPESTQLATRTSALTVAPKARKELADLSPADLWALEERASEFRSVCRELNDERLQRWIKVEGMTQAEVARLIGRDQSTVSRRCAALGIRPTSNRGRPIMQTHNSEPDDAEVVDAEPRAAPGPSPKAYVADTPRKRQIAERNLARLHQVVIRALDERSFDSIARKVVPPALAVASEDDLDEMEAELEEGARNFRRLRDEIRTRRNPRV